MEKALALQIVPSVDSAAVQRHNHLAVFSGGRGGASILKALRDQDDVSLSVLINGYDDGMSTGLLRRAMPEMLGPSDFRKVSHVLGCNSTIIEVLDRRVPLRSALLGVESNEYPLLDVFRNLFHEPVAILSDYCLHTGEDFEQPMALGNLLFAGFFLQASRSTAVPAVAFESAVASYGRVCGMPDHVEIVPVSGVPAALAASTVNGGVIGSEFAVTVSRLRIARVYVTPEPSPNTTAEEVLKSASAILYAPGTLHSSLLPSLYVMREALCRTAVPRIYIANAKRDAGMQGMTVADVERQMTQTANARVLTRAIVDRRSDLYHPSQQWPTEDTVDWLTGLHDGQRVVEVLRKVRAIR